MRSSRNQPSRVEKGDDSTIQRGFVSSSPTIDDGNIPIVNIVPTGEQSPIPAEVIRSVSADRLLPSEGDEVYFADRRGDMHVVLGVVPRDHDGYDQNERVISHPTEDTYIEFDENGDVLIHVNDGTDIRVSDGTIQINDGNQPVVTDIQTSTSDGYVTDVTTTTDDSILL